MKVTREKFAENREKIIEVAGALFREKGFDGVSVAEIMKAAGLTHGGFYGHFTSKDDLAAQASAAALSQSAQRWRELARSGGENPLSVLVRRYLSERHRDDSAQGCALAGLGGETARQSTKVRDSFTDGLKRMIDSLMEMVPSGSDAERRRAALATASALVGAIILARAVEDRELSNEILSAVSDDLLGGAKQVDGEQ
ncbi:TetR/AcrR family transcriptional repressor of nem operon [Rhodoligotrophos appendicifer]|uniref:TetR/AcrR family transcriptional regulator n=1 Tax=Rhodoligotrophos appendicifer TaxID=987056 RepID=UPI00117F7B64|nr:TetR/AcrR family transcriptional regulator [Rhodoligotrophos appendicifer]